MIFRLLLTGWRSPKLKYDFPPSPNEPHIHREPLRAFGYACVFMIAIAAMLLLAPMGQAQTSAAPAAGSTLNVATRAIRPFVFEENGKLTGFSVELWRLIAQRLGVESNFDVQPTVKDLLAAVKDKRDRVGVSAISITAEREREFDFSQPMFETGLGVMARVAPSGGGLSMLAMLDWNSIAKFVAIFLLLNLIPAHVIWWDHLRHEKTDDDYISRKYMPGVLQAAYWLALTWGAQSAELPVRWLGRIMHLLTVYGSVFFVAFFIASASSTLTLQQMKSDISGPADLPGKQVATVKGSTSVDYLRGIGAHPIEATDIDAAIELLSAGKVDAVVYDMPVLQYYVSHSESTALQVVGEPFLKGNYGIVFASDDTLRKSVNEALLALTEDGTIANLNAKWFGAKTSDGAK